MARFILDVANLDDTGIQVVLDAVDSVLGHHVLSMFCIDETNDNQFYSNGEGTNQLTKEQIDRFNKVCDE